MTTSYTKDRAAQKERVADMTPPADAKPNRPPAKTPKQRQSTRGLRGANQQTRPAVVDLARRRAAVVDLRRRNATFEEIAATMVREGLAGPKYDKKSAHTDFKIGIHSILAVPVKEYKALQQQEIDDVKRQLRLVLRGQHAVGAKIQAAGTLLNYLKREAELQGLDAPKRSQIEIIEHWEALAQLATGTLAAGLDALDLTPEAREKALAACKAHLAETETRAGGRDELMMIDGEVVE
jgi:hypothetical protein